MTAESEEAIEKLRALPRGDVEHCGAASDQIIRDLLLSLGYDAVVEAWDEVPRWYA